MLDAAVLLDRSPVRHGTFYFHIEWFLLLVFVVAVSLRLGLGFNGLRGQSPYIYCKLR